MSIAIKLIEKIGEQASIKQFNNSQEVLTEFGITEDLLSEINAKNGQLICGLFPEDDTEDDTEEENDDQEE